MKVLETIIFVIQIIEVNPSHTFKTAYDNGIESSLSNYNLNHDQRTEVRQRADEMYKKIEFLPYVALVVSALSTWLLNFLKILVSLFFLNILACFTVFLVYFPLVVYSYLVAIKRQDATNAYSSPVDKNCAASRKGYVISAPPDSYNPYVTTYPNVQLKV